MIIKYRTLGINFFVENWMFFFIKPPVNSYKKRRFPQEIV